MIVKEVDRQTLLSTSFTMIIILEVPDNSYMFPSYKLISLADLYHTTTDYLLCRNRITEELSLSVEGLSQKQIKLLRELIDTMRE